MNERRIARSLRVLRRFHGLRQRDVADRAGVSQATVSALERGEWQAMSIRALAAVFGVVEADVELVLRFRGGGLDRLLDELHAATVAELATLLGALGWRVDVEVSFNDYGDRGSIDLLAYHPATRTLLVAEVKTEIASVEETLRRLDVKVRVAPKVAFDRFGESPARVVRLLAIRASTVNRQRVARLEPLLGPIFPLRGRAMTAWLRSPGPIVGGRPGGLLFVRNISPADRTSGERRVRLGHRGESGRPRA